MEEDNQNIFEDDLEFESKYKKTLMQLYKRYLESQFIEIIEITKEKYPNRSKYIDAEFFYTFIDNIVDFKVRRKEKNRYYDIDMLIETESIKINGEKIIGWFDKLKHVHNKNPNHITSICYSWEDKNGTGLEPHIYVLPFTDIFIQWFEANKENFKTVPSPNHNKLTHEKLYTTYCKAVPISELKKQGFIIDIGGGNNDL